jgi:hypothetical protein
LNKKVIAIDSSPEKAFYCVSYPTGAMGRKFCFENPMEWDVTGEVLPWNEFFSPFAALIDIYIYLRVMGHR